MNNNTCYTYFSIRGNFDPYIISEMLQLQPDKSHKIGDPWIKGKKYDFASWHFGKCDEYNVYTENQMHKTIEPLLDKINILNEIKNKFDVDFYLEIVPTIYANSVKPSLAPSLKVIDFCYATRTNIDIDLYVLNDNE